MLIREAVTADARAIARVHVDAWRTAYRGILADRILDGLSYELRQASWRSTLTDHRARNHIHVAEDETAGVVGFVAAGSAREGPKGFEGEIFAIYILQEFQGRGIGRMLMRQAAEILGRLGMRSVLLWVLSDNPSRAFYKRLGGQQLDTKQITIEGDSLEEVAYGWPDLRVLLGERSESDPPGR